MNLIQVFLEAFRAMGMNRLRAGLTMLGIIIGVGAVVLMLAIGEGVRDSINRQIASLGSNVIFIVPGATSANGVRSGRGQVQTLTFADATAIAELPTFAAVAPVVQQPFQISSGSTNWNANVMGVTPDFFSIREWEIDRGSFFGDVEIRSASRVAVIGATTAENLYGQADPIGQTIRLRNRPFEVIGVMAAKGNGIDGGDQDDVVVVPFSTARQQLIRWGMPGSIHYAIAEAASAEQMQDAIYDATQLLRIRHRLREDQEDDFTIRDQASIAAKAAEISGLLTLLLGAIGSISLLVGGIGIMNIMLVSVTERTREIGIRMALGAKRRDVLLQFLTEAIVICVCGGAIGVGLAYLGSEAITNFSPMTVGISMTGIIIAFSFSAMIGIFFGFYPAKRASTLKPVEALRYE
jgi:putative ABC transport system permease protein